MGAFDFGWIVSELLAAGFRESELVSEEFDGHDYPLYRADPDSCAAVVARHGDREYRFDYDAPRATLRGMLRAAMKVMA